MGLRIKPGIAAAVLFIASGCGGSTTSTSQETTPSPVAAGCKVNTSDAYAKAVLADQPAVYYRLGDASGSKMCDASAGKDDGTYGIKGITYQQPGALQGIKDTAIAADGTGNPATSDGNSPVFGSVDFSLEAWFKTTSKQDQILVDIGQGGAGRIAGIGPSSAPGNSLCGGVSNAIGFDTYDGYVTADAGAAGVNVFDGNWHYAVGAYTAAGGGSVDIFLDGKLLKSAKIADAPATSVVRVGYWIDAVCNSPFAGSLDEVAIYHSALTSQQVKAHYAAAGH